MTRRDMLGTSVAALAAATATTAKADMQPNASPQAGILDDYDALGLAKLVRDKQVTPGELLEEAIARAEAMNPLFNFMEQKNYDFARAAIKQGLPQGAFTGVPWLLKDLHTYLEGTVTQNGSRFYKGDVATFTSDLVKRHEQAGFVIFGKTTCPEFGLTGTTENKVTGDTRNPWNPHYISGGSSGGAATAIAAGVLPAAHATDGGGSIRIPSSCCGLFGMKPSRGRVPMGPPHTEGWGGLSVEHAISRTVRDSAAVMDVTWGLEPGSRYSAPAPDGTFLSQVGRSPGRLRIALMVAPLSHCPVDPECAAAARAAAHLCESLGHYVEEAAPVIDVAALGEGAFAVISASLAVEIENRAKATGIVPGPDVLEPITLAFLAYGQHVSGADFVKGNNAFQAAAVAMSNFMQNYDVILTPTLAEPPLPLGQIGLSPGVNFETWGKRAAQFTPFTQIANMTGQPAMSVPLSMSSKGLPIGIQFIGRYGQEALLFRLAGQLEQAAPWKDRRPPHLTAA
ncbi:6-aminohexanoate-cyclic-dimer hydrolase [Acidocella aquatica]|uniref:6-aminohexanoate-cyclic-dimer hydrolase n=1 Tax=Acidocella aquatica TaxID=1922313 RepID=A0ABQ6A467_9PROT|nr:amidase [Acidocella aquatica]GLR66045.1 6-aminohexanoate-cyclic-dimer hydrolase [Acidocella aquatica]